MSNFRVGQKVACVNDDNTHLVKKGSVYQIEGMCTANHGQYYLVLIGIGLKSPPDQRGMRAERFRPLITRKTDISVFTRILDDVRRLERAGYPMGR